MAHHTACDPISTQANRGQIFVGTSHDTPAFSATALAQWWAGAGRRRYSQTKRLLILADCGGSNGSRIRAWEVRATDPLV